MCRKKARISVSRDTFEIIRNSAQKSNLISNIRNSTLVELEETVDGSQVSSNEATADEIVMIKLHLILTDLFDKINGRKREDEDNVRPELQL